MLFDFNKIIERNEEAYIFASMYLDLLSNGTSIIDDKILYNEFQDSRSDQLQIIISFLLKKNYLSDAKSALSIFKQHNFLKFLEKAGEPIRGNDINKFGFNNSIGASIKSKNIQIDLIDQRINREKSSSEILKLQKLKILLKSELRLAYKSSNSVVKKTSNLTRSKKNIAEGNVYVDFFYKDNKLSIVYSDKSIITKFDAEIDALEFSKAIFELSKFNLSSTDNYSIANINFLYSSLILPIESLLIKSNSKNLFIRSNSFITSIPFKLLFSSTNSDLKYLNVLYLGIEGGASDNFLLSEESSLFASTNKFGNLTALKSAELELNYISNIFELNFPITFKTRKFLNNEFTFDKLIHEFSSNSNTLHIATHYNSNRNNGGLLLGTGQIVSPKQIWKSLPISPNRKLIIISACESGLLNDLGESFDDLPNVFLNKGAKFVVSSLWKISDSGTAEFMQLFYAILMISKDPSIALNLTQSSFADGNFNKLYSKYTLDDTFKTKYKHILLNYSHPFYWAGFQLISNN
jgi:CHAT domain-containing protein